MSFRVTKTTAKIFEVTFGFYATNNRTVVLQDISSTYNLTLSRCGGTSSIRDGVWVRLECSGFQDPSGSERYILLLHDENLLQADNEAIKIKQQKNAPPVPKL
jgi:hypothetical protein